MKSVFKPIFVAAMLASAGLSAFSQAPAGPERGAMMGSTMHDSGHHGRMGKMDPAKMQAWMDKRNAELKARLKLTPAQEGAWVAYTSAMKPPAELVSKRTDRAELDKLPTPERIDKMKTLRNQHMTDMTAAMDKRDEATKAFYAALTPEQQKVFDANATRHHGHEGRKGGPRGSKPAAPVKP